MHLSDIILWKKTIFTNPLKKKFRNFTEIWTQLILYLKWVKFFYVTKKKETIYILYSLTWILTKAALDHVEQTDIQKDCSYLNVLINNLSCSPIHEHINQINIDVFKPSNFNFWINTWIRFYIIMLIVFYLMKLTKSIVLFQCIFFFIIKLIVSICKDTNLSNLTTFIIFWG